MRLQSATVSTVVRYLTLFAGLGALFVLGVVLNHPSDPDESNRFLSIGNQRDVLEQVSINGILAVGMTLVILTAGIDLSVGSVLSLCSVVCAMLLMHGAGADGRHTLSRAQWIVLPAVALFSGLGVYGLAGRWIRGHLRSVMGVGCFVIVFAVLGLSAWRWNLSASGAGYSTLAVLVAVPAVGGMMGMINGVIITKTKLQPFIVTLAMMISAVGLAKFIAGHGGQVHSIYMATAERSGAPASFAALGEPILTVGEKTLRTGKVLEVKLIPIPGLFMLGCWGLTALILQKYPLGRYIYAVGGNEETARLAGVQVDGVKIFVYCTSGLLAGLAAVLFCANYKQGLATAGQMKELDAIAAVVIGGTSLMGGRGSIVGTLVGIMIFGYLTNILNLKGVSSEIQDIVKGVIIVGAAALQAGHLYQRLRWPRGAGAAPAKAKGESRG